MMVGRKIAGFIAIAVLIATVLVGVHSNWGVPVRAWGMLFLRPVFETASRVREAVRVSDGDERIRALEEENRRRTASLFLLETLREENAGLRRMIGFSESRPGRVVRARVILFTREQGREVLMLDRGTEAGIERDAVVIDDTLFLVGRVTEAGSGFAKVDIASNPDMLWEVELTSLGVRAVAQGLGARAFSMEYIGQNVSLEKGTFFSVRVAGSPLLLGEVATIRKSDTTTFQEARGALLADPARMSFVTVLLTQ